MARRSKENAIDWDAIERQYRLGKKSNKQLGEEFGVDHSSIGRRAKKCGWVADKSQEVDAITNSLLIQNASGNANPNATPTQLEVKAAAQTNADVVLEHRKDIGRSRALFRGMLEELEVASSEQGKQLIVELVEVMSPQAEDEDGIAAAARAGRMQRLLERVTGTPQRIDSAKKLVEMLEKLVRLEREAFGIDNSKGGEGGVEDVLKRVHQLL